MYKEYEFGYQERHYRRLGIWLLIVILALACACGGLAGKAIAAEVVPIAHTVQSGEHLWCIARAYGIPPQAIAIASGLWGVEQPLQPGWILTIPAGPQVVLPPGPICRAQGTQATIETTQAVAAQQLIRYSYYWPPLGGTNCFSFYNGYCHSATASGARWEDWVNRGVACPPEWPFGTTVTLNGKVWTCVDRGGAIKYRKGIPWVDFLRRYAEYSYGTVVEVTVTKP